jgi:hypothetical protein
VTSSVSDASAGGAGGASGVGFQNQVFAWAAASVIAEEPLLQPLVVGTVVQVGAQTGSEVDDVVVLTDSGNGVFLQAKIKLASSTHAGSPLSKGLKQAVRQYLVGTVPEPGSSGRRFDPARDAIVLCTDHAAPSTIRVDLAAAVSRVASQPSGTVLGAELTKKQDRVLSVALDHIRRLWSAETTGGDPSDEEIRALLKGLHILTLDLDDGRKDQQAAIGVLHRGIAEAKQGLVSWRALVNAGQVASEKREWRDRAALALALSYDGVVVSVPARYAPDVALIRGRSTVNLASLQTEARLPITPDGLFITRSVAKTLRDLQSRQPTLVVGDAGCGKSAVLQDLATSRHGVEEVVVLLAADVAGANKLQTAAPLQEVLRAWPGPPGLVVIDGLDALRGSEDRESLSKTVSAMAGTRWQVVASARSFDTRNSQPVRKAFAGTPISGESAEVDPRLPDVRHLLVGDLSDADLDREFVAPMPLAIVLTEASRDLRQLLRNPFNLRLAAELVKSLTSSQHDDLLEVRSRVELLGRYWDWRIRNEFSYARDALLRRLVLRMVADRRLQVVLQEPTVLASDSAALEALLSQGVLSTHDGPIPGLGRALGFSHNILFDYATAIYVLHHPVDPSGLVTTLDADPSLPLIARPSFDLLIDMLWRTGSSGDFWSTVLMVANSEHVLASLAIASRIVNLATSGNDLLELAATDIAPTGALCARQQLIRQIVSAARAPAVLPDAARAVSPLARLARALAENAVASYTDGALATDLVLALQARAPMKHGGPSADDYERAEAIALVLDACRSDPRAREAMAGALVRQLENVIAGSIEVRDAVRRLLDDTNALGQWGGTVTMWFPDASLATLESDPELACRLAVVSMTFKEVREESVELGLSQVLPLNESRKQQAQHAAYRLVKNFPQICATDVVTATAIACGIVASGVSTGEVVFGSIRPSWPMVGYGAVGSLNPSYGFGLSRYSHKEEQKMLKAVADALLEAQPELQEKAVFRLVTEVREGWVWASLMQDTPHPGKLARILFPAFESGTVLAHPDTFTYASTLIKAAVEERTVSHQEIEAAVVRAMELVDVNDRSVHVKDVLVGCLDPAAITDGAIAAHLASLGDEVPDIPSPPTVVTEIGQWSRVDQLVRQGDITLGSEIEQSARYLQKRLDEAGTNRPGTDSEMGNLVEALTNAQDTFAAALDTPAGLENLVLEAACRLACDPLIGPDHTVALLLMEILEQGSEHPDAGKVSP